jgi:hypothetical protein
MLLSTTEVESALRALRAIEDNRQPSQEDSLTLRLWAGPRYRMGPLEEIATNILKVAEEPSPRGLASHTIWRERSVTPVTMSHQNRPSVRFCVPQEF